MPVPASEYSTSSRHIQNADTKEPHTHASISTAEEALSRWRQVALQPALHSNKCKRQCGGGWAAANCKHSLWLGSQETATCHWQLVQQSTFCYQLHNEHDCAAAAPLQTPLLDPPPALPAAARSNPGPNHHPSFHPVQHNLFATAAHGVAAAR